MLKELLKNKELNKIVNKYLEKTEIIDILLFGSATKGKENPNDLDFLILFTDSSKNNHEISYNLRKELEKIYDLIDITPLKYSEIFSSSFLGRESILSNSFSFKNKNYFSKSLGYQSFILFRYSLKNLNKSQRMSFYYTLYGRGKEKGFLEKNSAIKFSNEIILSFSDNSEIFKDFFKSWKLEYVDFPILVPLTEVKHSLNKIL